MKLNTVSSVEADLSKIDLWIIVDILNTMRRKSWVFEECKIPPIHVRCWNIREIVQYIILQKNIPHGYYISNKTQRAIHIILPPRWIILKWRKIYEPLYILCHEMVHAFWKWFKKRKNYTGLHDTDEWITDIIAVDIFNEYCNRTWIYKDVGIPGYFPEIIKISNLIDYLESKWYGSKQLLKDSLIQGHMSGIDLFNILPKLKQEWVDETDLSKIILGLILK
jgi:hypothetical protein